MLSLKNCIFRWLIPSYMFGLNCGATGAVIGAAVIGAGATAYGANKQGKAVKGATAETNAANAANTLATNKYNWNNYLMTRGVAPITDIEPGQLPAEGQYRSVNARLPLWAKWSTADGLKN